MSSKQARRLSMTLAVTLTALGAFSPADIPFWYWFLMLTIAAIMLILGWKGATDETE